MKRLLLSLVALVAWANASPAQRLFGVIVDGKYGYIDSTGRIVIAPRFPEATHFSEGLARACIGPQRYQGCGYIDTTGRWVLEPQTWRFSGRFSEGLAPIRVDLKMGYIDRTGRMVITPSFTIATDFADGLAAVDVDGKWGYIDRTGRMVIPPTFQSAGAFADGLAPVATGDSGALIDTSGTAVITVSLKSLDPDPVLARLRWTGSPDWEPAFTEGRAAVPLGDRWGFVDRAGKMIISARFEHASRFAEGMAAVRLNGKWGYIDTTGTLRIQPQWEVVHPFSEGLAQVEVYRRDRWQSGYIDRTGGVVIAPRFAYATDFSGGLACVGDSARWRAEECGEWYIDHKGRRVWDAKRAPRPTAADSATVLVDVSPSPRKDSTTAAPDTTSLPGTGPFLDRIAAVAAAAESGEVGTAFEQLLMDRVGDSSAAAQAQTQARNAPRAAAQLAIYLETHPDDVRAWILSAQLGRLLVPDELLRSAGQPEPTLATLAGRYARYHAALDHALALDSTNAEAHYWKGRLYALAYDWWRTLYSSSDAPAGEASRYQTYSDSAIWFGRRAVALAPTRDDYKTTLAVTLLLRAQDAEAETLLRGVAGGRHPLSRIAVDWKRMPLPGGATLVPETGGTLDDLMSLMGAPLDHMPLRVRTYVVPAPIASVQAFYAARWPGFHLHLMESGAPDSEQSRTFTQHVWWREGQARVARNEQQDLALTEGILMMVTEVTHATAEERATLPITVGNTFCMLMLINVQRAAK